MVTVPIRTDPNQTFQVVLGEQNCSLRLYTRGLADGSQPLYMDLYVDESGIFFGQLCKDGIVMPLYDYLPFEGGLLFVDLQGNDDPVYYGLGDRWQLLYLTAAEVAQYKNGTLTAED